jgi:ribosomal protein S12 methylthiotransferase accessory factor YcaO
LPPAGRAARVFDRRALADPVVDDLCEQVRAAGLDVQLIDQTSDIGVPVIMALIGPSGEAPAAHLELAAGYGAHPIAARAAIRAITEAAQSRVTGIASSRDDITDAAFAGDAAGDNAALFRAPPVVPAPAGAPIGLPLPALLDGCRLSLANAGIDAVTIRVDGGDLPFAVVKVLSRALEDRDANLNWRPGARALERLLAA